MIKTKTTHPDAFMFEIIDNNEAWDIYHNKTIYKLYDDDTESMIDNEDDLEDAIISRHTLGVEMGFKNKLSSIGSGKAKEIFNTLYEGETFFDITYDTPLDYVTSLTNSLKDKSGAQFKNVLELILSSLFIRENIAPLFLKAKYNDVPCVTIPIMLTLGHDHNTAILVACNKKGLLRCDLEAAALKYKHKHTVVYVLYYGAEKDRENIEFMAIDNVIDVATTDINIMCSIIKRAKYINTPGKFTCKESPYRW